MQKYFNFYFFLLLLADCNREMPIFSSRLIQNSRLSVSRLSDFLRPKPNDRAPSSRLFEFRDYPCRDYPVSTVYIYICGGLLILVLC